MSVAASKSFIFNCQEVEWRLLLVTADEVARN
jgi:hypothetical protein